MFSFQKRVNIFALFWSPGLFEKIREMLIEMDGLSLAAPVRQFLIVRQKDKKFDPFFDRPSLVIKD